MINMKDVRACFAEELRTRMEDEGLEISDISEYCNLSQDKVKFCLQLGSLPDPWTLIFMADCLWCTVNDLLGYGVPKDPAELLTCQVSSFFSDKREYATCFSSKLRRHMNEKGLSVEDLSCRADVNIRALRQWISTNPSLPKTPDLLCICDALDCTPSDLLGY